MLCPYCRTENRLGSTRCAACTSWMVTRQPIREWTRAREGLVLGGVCRGLATRWGLPVAALRLAFILGTVFAFWGLVIYIALWVVMPREPLLLPGAPLAEPPTPVTDAGPSAAP